MEWECWEGNWDGLGMLEHGLGMLGGSSQETGHTGKGSGMLRKGKLGMLGELGGKLGMLGRTALVL